MDTIVDVDVDRARSLVARRVLEIACGTGFWTHKGAQAAERIAATDAAPETLRIARGKGVPAKRIAAACAAPEAPPFAGSGAEDEGAASERAAGAGRAGDGGVPLRRDLEGEAVAGGLQGGGSLEGESNREREGVSQALERVTFLQGDAYRLQAIPGEFDAALAMFWFSHVLKALIPSFLDGLHRRVGPGAIVFMADNVFVPGIGGKLIVRPDEADTYKLRELADGSEHAIVKNYFTEPELAGIFDPISTELRITMGACYWWLS